MHHLRLMTYFIYRHCSEEPSCVELLIVGPAVQVQEPKRRVMVSVLLCLLLLIQREIINPDMQQ